MTKTSMLRAALFAGAATAAGLTLLPAQEARADDCLLDTNNDGNADSNVDTDLGADSEWEITNVACGQNANVDGLNSVGVGAHSEATGGQSTAVGSFASARGTGASSAFGYAAKAT